MFVVTTPGVAVSSQFTSHVTVSPSLATFISAKLLPASASYVPGPTSESTAWVISSLHSVGRLMELRRGRSFLPSLPGTFTKGDGVHWICCEDERGVVRTGERKTSEP